MDIGETLHAANRSEWRTWLEKFHQEKREIWLVTPHASTGTARMTYNDAVEEALCFGWIDSIVKKFENSSSAQRYTPRNPRSPYSQMNIERLRWLAERDMIISNVLEVVKPLLDIEFVFPEDIIEALKADDEVWENYLKFSEPYKRIRVALIDNSRARPEIFEKRLNHFIKKTAGGRQYGHGGIAKYY